jgi:hypothetical protein
VLLVKLIGHGDAQLRLFSPVAGASEIPDVLLHRRPGLQVVDGIRVVQGREGKVGCRESALRQQRAEYKHRIVAGQIGLLDIQARQVSRPCGFVFRTRGLLAGCVDSQVGIISQRAGNGFG